MRAPQCLTKVGGEPVGIRTRDLQIKSPLLYQLSYGPTKPRPLVPRAGAVNQLV